MLAFVETFPAYLAGLFKSFDKIILAVAVTTSSFLNELGQRNRKPNNSFWFGKFKYILDTTGVNYIDYKFVHDGKVFLISIHLFDTQNCGRGSNLNFVNYIWENYSIVPCRKYSIVTNVKCKLLYIRFYILIFGSFKLLYRNSYS